MENKHQLITSAGSQIILRLVGTGISLLTVKLIAATYGVAGTGIFNTITTYLAWITVVADFGLFSYGVREIARRKADEQRIFSALLGLRLITALVASLVAVLLIFLLQSTSQLAVGVTIASSFVFLNLTASAFDIVFQCRLVMQYSAQAELLSKLFTLLAVAIAYRLHGGLYWTIASIPLSGLIILVSKALSARRFVRPFPTFKSQEARYLLVSAAPLGIVFILNNLYFKIDTLILFAVKGATAVGYYSLAYKVLEVALFAGSYITSSFKPLFSLSFQNSQRYEGRALSQGIRALLMLSLPITVVLMMYSKPLVLLLSTAQFAPSSTLLQILSLSIPLLYLDMLLGEALLARGDRRVLLCIAGGMLALILLTDLLAIPRFGALGAAWATVGCEFVLLLVNLFFCSRFAKLWPSAFDFLKQFLALGILIALIILLSSLPFFFGINAVIALAGYVLVLYFIGALHFE